ncbi:hypothetical protein HPB48_009839 [Haemaphysalis longicornis]|uniref:Plus3 domain-containing protein n=1 Tax=Haemaphysalis longicornis TaxID=44386 RepID=A0A9J6GTE4_HAELO|nr:hypothetical protein HPB48_009839 [Haemaphysalis longicornis]
MARKLKARDIYSDDEDYDTSDRDCEEDNKAGGDSSERRHSSSSSSSSLEDEKVAHPQIVATKEEVSKIQEVSKAKVYTLGRPRTNKGLRLKHGKQEWVFRARVVSNQDSTDSNFYKWTEGTTKEVARKLKDVQGALNCQYKESDVETIVSEKQRFKRNPSNYAVRKTQIMKQKEITMLKGVQEEAQRLAGELEQHEERARELDKQLTSTVSTMSYIIERKRLQNIVEIERAILEDAKLNKEKADDLFTRRNCPASLVTKTRGADVKPAAVAPPPIMNHEEPVVSSLPVIDALLTGKRTVGLPPRTADCLPSSAAHDCDEG